MVAYRTTDADALKDAILSGTEQLNRCVGLTEALYLLSKAGKPADDVPATVVRSVASIMDDALREIEDAFSTLQKHIDAAE
ncbi:hypothetical protein MBUL_04499 (plasmid) [Methylobacterium bullatum]|uniref:Uncharacterized protein n=1 Tax=Methylobacterium bullatum TaxID=570505 RepID=A0A679JCA3_9HYPH|nr:hypothetical protein MBUL_04499 [Methylobacterium bullatum]